MSDFATAQRELDVTKNANYDAVCFHAQQCVEKYLKANLQTRKKLNKRSRIAYKFVES
ncbi:MAG: HEPN domain-containing protein [Cyanobacteria bacterium J06626_6]